MITDDEKKALELSGELAGLLRQIIGTGPQADNDWAEMAASIHVIQRAILAQSGGREYPGQYRLLGESLST